MRLVIEGDNTIVIRVLKGEIISLWTKINLIKDMGKFLSLCRIINI